MTWDELNKKYPEARDEMSADRERDFLKDLYDTYETVGFANKFWTPFDLNDEDKSYIGKPFKVIGRCEEGKEWDLESLPAWRIEFEDGHKMAAYREEICLNGMYEEYEEMMIDYIMNKATQEEVEEFFGHTAYGVCTREACENNLAQMPFEEFDMFVKKFGLPARPSCYVSNEEVYPQCKGNGEKRCHDCCLFEDYDVYHSPFDD